MFKKKTTAETNLQELIDTAYTQMYMHDVNSDEYNKCLNQIERLHKLQSLEKTTGFHVSADTVVAAAASILGIVIIVSYEHLHPILSKGLGFVPKTKI